MDTSSLLIVDSSFFSLLRKKAPSTFEKIRLQIFRHVTSTFFDAEAAEIPCHLAAFLVTNLCEAAPDEGCGQREGESVQGQGLGKGQTISGVSRLFYSLYFH